MSDKERAPRAYIDINVVDDIAKELLPLAGLKDAGVDWVYSNEHFVEIKRAGQDYFLDVLSELGAKRLEPELDEKWRFTGALFLSVGDPHEFYRQWQETTSSTSDFSELLTPFIARSFGAANDAEYAALPVTITEALQDLLDSAEFPSSLSAEVAAVVGGAFETITQIHLQERVVLEDVRSAMGTHDGRAGNLRHTENPLLDLWEIIRKTLPETDRMSADQFFGFDPPTGFDYERYPLLLGIVGCYIRLNSLGYRPDEKLSRASRAPAVMSDANHVAHAAACDALVSQDKRMCDKASAIYRYKSLPVSVVRIEKGKAA